MQSSVLSLIRKSLRVRTAARLAFALSPPLAPAWRSARLTFAATRASNKRTPANAKFLRARRRSRKTEMQAPS